MRPVRKKHRLEESLYSQPGAYFITVCVKDRRPLLSTVVGAEDHFGPQIQLTEIGAVVQKYTQSIPGIGHYVIMPNHVHMILHISAKEPHGGPMWSSAPTKDAGVGPMWSSAPTDAGVGPMWSSAPTKDAGVGPMWSSAPTKDAGIGPMWSSAPTDANILSLVRTWKTLITKELGQSIWQRSSYDHVIRSEQEYVEIAEYIMGNPGKWAEDKYFC